MIAEHGVATRYLEAYLGKSTQNVDRLAELITAIEALLSDQESYQKLKSPFLSHEDKESLLATATQKISTTALIQRFFQVLLKQQRIDLLPVLHFYAQRWREEQSEKLPVQVSTAAKISDATKQQISSLLEKQLGRSVDASYAEDPSLLGGFKATASGHLIDASLQYQLKHFVQNVSE